MVNMKIGKTIFGISLFIAFMAIFGFEAIHRYRDEAVLVSTRKGSSSTLLKGPAVTVCVDPNEIIGEGAFQSEVTTNFEDGVKRLCDLNDSSNDIIQFKQCFEKKYLNTSEMIKTILLNMTKSTSNWIEKISQFSYGKCQALQHYGELGNDAGLNALSIQLNPIRKYVFFLHDPDFFFINQNSIAMPRIESKIGLGGKKMVLKYQHLSALEHILINRESSPCIEDTNYKYSHCIRKYVLKEAGCSLSFEKNTFDVDGCDSNQKILNFFETYYKLVRADLDQIVKKTGCLSPCSYMEYVLTGEEVYAYENVSNNKEELTLKLDYASTQLTIKEEILVYPIESFLAEIGGSLGMFLGFSLFMLWDLFEYAFGVFFRSGKF